MEDAAALNEHIQSALVDTLNDLDVSQVSAGDRSVSLALVLARRLFGSLPASTGLSSLPGAGTFGGVQGAGRPPETPAAGGGDMLDRIAAKLELDRETVELIYVERDGELSLGVSPRRFGSVNATAARELALLLASGRQAAGIEEWTKLAVIRPVVADFGKLDGANFSAHINKMDNEGGVVLHGKNSERQMKVNRVGFGLAGDLVKRLTSK